MVLLWLNTASWMQATGFHESLDHLSSALRLFPKDATLLFLGGAEHESLARPAIQAAARSSTFRPGISWPSSRKRRSFARPRRSSGARWRRRQTFRGAPAAWPRAAPARARARGCGGVAPRRRRGPRRPHEVLQRDVPGRRRGGVGQRRRGRRPLPGRPRSIQTHSLHMSRAALSRAAVATSPARSPASNASSSWPRSIRTAKIHGGPTTSPRAARQRRFSMS